MRLIYNIVDLIWLLFSLQIVTILWSSTCWTLFLFFFQKGGIDYLKYEDPDIFCLQETKCSESKLPPEVKVDGYHTYWLAGSFKLPSVEYFHHIIELYCTGAVGWGTLENLHADMDINREWKTVRENIII
jgi:hypothetical protein